MSKTLPLHRWHNSGGTAQSIWQAIVVGILGKKVNAVLRPTGNKDVISRPWIAFPAILYNPSNPLHCGGWSDLVSNSSLRRSYRPTLAGCAPAGEQVRSIRFSKRVGWPLLYVYSRHRISKACARIAPGYCPGGFIDRVESGRQIGPG